MNNVPARDWKLSDEEFEGLKTVFEMKAESSRTTEVVQGDIEKFDAMIAENVSNREEQWHIAIVILLQARNFLARYIGEEELLIPEECIVAFENEQAGIKPSPIDERYIAIIGRDQPLAGKALAQVLLKALNNEVRCRSFESMDLLLQAVVKGEVCGVLALHGVKKRSVIGWLQHDLKNLPSFSAQWQFTRRVG